MRTGSVFREEPRGHDSPRAALQGRSRLDLRGEYEFVSAAAARVAATVAAVFCPS
jgi:hypothetical protein